MGTRRAGHKIHECSEKSGQAALEMACWQPLPTSIRVGGEVRGLEIDVYSLRSETDIARQSKGVWRLPTKSHFPT